MPDTRKLLCIADGSIECRTAVLFGAERAKRNGSSLVILRVVDAGDNSLVASLGVGVMDDLRLEALENLQELSILVRQKTGITPSILIKEGEVHKALRELITEDGGIKTLLLAASSSKSGPGPLVSEATRGALGLDNRPVAVMIVPAGLNDDEITELAS